MTAVGVSLCVTCRTTPPPETVVVDLDGTILDEADQLHPTDRAALRSAASTAGVIVATARPAPDAARWADTIGARACIALGGAAVVSGPGSVWTAPPVPAPIVDHLRHLATKHGADLHLHTLTGWHPPADTPAVRAYGQRHGLRPLTSPPRDPVLMAELVAPPGGLPRYDPSGGLAASPTVATRTDDARGSYLVVTAAGADKRAALARVLGAHGIGWDRVLAMGDGALDAPMLAAAATAVVPPRAHPLARAAATHALSTGPGGGSIATALAALFLRSPGPHPLITCLHRKEAR